MLSGHRISQSNHPMLEIQRNNNSFYVFNCVNLSSLGKAM